MIVYKIVYTCDFEGCEIQYTDSPTYWYFKTLVMSPTIPRHWTLVTNDGHYSKLYCRQHVVLMEECLDSPPKG